MVLKSGVECEYFLINPEGVAIDHEVEFYHPPVLRAEVGVVLQVHHTQKEVEFQRQ